VSVYTDGIHLMADEEAELHAFAKRMGLNKDWYQPHPRHPHYDLTTGRMRRKAVYMGAVVVPDRELVRR